MMIRALALSLILATLAPPALAKDEPSDLAWEFVENNVLSTFYHELGHALIDVLDLPVLGQEEDAADILSVLMTDEIWQPKVALEIAEASALSYWLQSEAEEAGEADPAYWDVHGHTLQRYYTSVCLFYGAAPKARAAFAREWELPAHRAATCPEEYQLAVDSWWTYLEDIEIDTDTPARSLVLTTRGDDPMVQLLADELDDLNTRFRLPRRVKVALEACGEANAYYDPNARAITICSEYIDYLLDQAEDAGL